jgi:D-methionine transport system substrate-binding protein
MLKKFLIIVFTGLFSLGGCHADKDQKEIRVGTISGPETQLMEVAKKVILQDYGLHLKIIEFTDYSVPNMALSDGSLDANMFQHQLFLDEEIKNRHYKLVSIAKLFVYPMGIYSKKIKRLDLLKQNALVAIPNDPSNEARALLLLQRAKLITLKNSKFKNLSTPHDILFNPKHLQIKELDAAQLTRALPDVDCAVINSNYAALENLYPQQDALFIEDKNSIYANLLVVQEKDKNNPKLEKLVNALHSRDVSIAAKTLFHGQAIPAWQ